MRVMRRETPRVANTIIIMVLVERDLEHIP
jgi:hypothetical protein